MKRKKLLVLVLALCLAMAYFPLQASAADPITRTIKSAADWTTLTSEIDNGSAWPDEIIIELQGTPPNPIIDGHYINSKITMEDGSFLLNAGGVGTVTVSGGSFTLSGSGNPASSVTVTDGTFQNGRIVTTAVVSGGEFSNEDNGTTNGLTLSGTGTFTNEGSLSGTIDVSGGTFNNKATGNVTSTVSMTGGIFNNAGTISSLELKGGTFNIQNPAFTSPITMSGGTINNNSGQELTLNINGVNYPLAAKGTIAQDKLIAAPTNAIWTADLANQKAEAQWTAPTAPADFDKLTNAVYDVTLYNEWNEVVYTQKVSPSTSSYDFTAAIIKKGQGDYHFRVKASAENYISSPEIQSGVFKYNEPSTAPVSKKDYAWDWNSETGSVTLTIKTNAGCTAWKTDTDILGTLITQDSFNLITQVIIGPQVTTLPKDMLPCQNIEDVILQSNETLTETKGWIDDSNTGAVCYADTTTPINHFPGSKEPLSCIITGIKDGQTFRGQGPSPFNVYGLGSQTNKSKDYTNVVKWSVTDASDKVVDSGTFTQNNDNAYTGVDIKLGLMDLGTYTLKVEYTITKVPAGGDVQPIDSTSLTFSIVQEDGGDPGPVYPPVQQYTITSSADQGGTITPEGRNTVYAGLSATYKIQVQDGYILKDVLVDDISAGPLTEYTFQQVSDDHTIHAVVEKKEEPDIPDDPDHPDKPNKPNKPGGKTDPAAGGTENKSPKTGDENRLLFWLFLAGAAGGTAAVIRRRICREKVEEHVPSHVL